MHLGYTFGYLQAGNSFGNSVLLQVCVLFPSYEQNYKTKQEPLALKLRVERQARDLSEERKQKVGNEREQRELRDR